MRKAHCAWAALAPLALFGCSGDSANPATEPSDALLSQGSVQLASGWYHFLIPETSMEGSSERGGQSDRHGQIPEAGGGDGGEPASSELVAAGVVLSSSGEYGVGGPTFVFTRLNQLKPSMVAGATANARAAAEQFAKDSRNALGHIRHANQGIFVILPRDQAPGVNESGQL